MSKPTITLDKQAHETDEAWHNRLTAHWTRVVRQLQQMGIQPHDSKYMLAKDRLATVSSHRVQSS